MNSIPSDSRCISDLVSGYSVGYFKEGKTYNIKYPHGIADRTITIDKIEFDGEYLFLATVNKRSVNTWITWDYFRIYSNSKHKDQKPWCITAVDS